MATASTNFRVIVVGGGPVGLTAAHIFSKLGIDFVVLEGRSTVAPDQGSGIIIGQNTLRVYDQLDISDAIADMNHPTQVTYIIDHSGKQYHTSHMFKWAKEAHGNPLLVLHRPDLVEVLFEKLPDDSKAKVLTDKKVIEVQHTEQGVTVHCADGSAFHGSIVIGADGVHSRVRKEMRRLALLQDPKATVNAEHPHLISYRCLYGSLPLLPGLETGVTWGSNGSHRSTQLFVGRDKAAFLAYEELPTPKRETDRYNKQDEKAFVERFGDIAVTDRYKLSDVYGVTFSSGLVDLQEGCMDVLAWERLVLVGDASNKQTPILGQGYNNGVQDLVTIATGLQELLERQASTHSSEVDMKDVRKVMAEYQIARLPESRDMVAKSGKVMRMYTWHTWLLWIIDRWVMPYLKLDKKLFHALSAQIVSKGKVLPSLEEKALKWGTVPWVHVPAASMKKDV